MRRHLRIFDAALADLLRHRGRSLVVVVVYAGLVALVASLLLFVRGMRLEAEHLLAGSPDLVVQRLRGGRHHAMPVDRAEAIRGMRGVAAVAPRVWGYSYDPPTGATFTLWGADSVPREALEFHGGDLLGLEAGGGCVVGRGVADLRFLGPGDRLPLLTADGELLAPRVTSVFAASSSLLTNDLVVLPTPLARRALGLGEADCTDLAVSVHNPAETATVARKIQERWTDVRPVSRRQILQTYQAAFDWRGGVWAAFLLSMVAAFGILVWDTATGSSAEERHLLGVLKAVGWRSRDVLELKLWQGMIVSGVSVATGLLAAQVHLVWWRGALFSRLLKGWSVLYPDFDVSPGLDAATALVCCALAVLPYAVASMVPSWRASITDPDTVLRG